MMLGGGPRVSSAYMKVFVTLLKGQDWNYIFFLLVIFQHQLPLGQCFDLAWVFCHKFCFALPAGGGKI